MAEVTVPALIPLAPLFDGTLIEAISDFEGSPVILDVNPVMSPPIEPIELLKSDFPGSNLGRLFILFLYLNSMIIYI